MRQDSGSQEIGQPFHLIEAIDPQTSLLNAARKMKKSGCSFIPVICNGSATTVLSEEDLLKGLHTGLTKNSPISKVLWRKTKGIPATIPPSEAKDLLEHSEHKVLIVLDNYDAPLGILTPKDLLFEEEHEHFPLPVIGGMATPFGVYLTTGSVSGGAPIMAMVATGAFIFSLFLISNILASLATSAYMPLNGSANAQAQALSVIALLFFFILLRLSPITGTHAAEHMTVHAIERGEELTPDIVSRMPRTHPRCGTNIAVAMSLFLGISGSNIFPVPELNLMLALLFTLFFWRPLGMFLQFTITTKPPSKKQLLSGIKAGKELLKNYRKTPAKNPPLGAKIWNSGILHILAGSTLTYFIFNLIFSLFHLPKWI